VLKKFSFGFFYFPKNLIKLYKLSETSALDTHSAGQKFSQVVFTRFASFTNQIKLQNHASFETSVNGSEDGVDGLISADKSRIL
jgi:hypothetical protein